MGERIFGPLVAWTDWLWERLSWYGNDDAPVVHTLPEETPRDA